jgi:hypothetical protein
VPLAAGDQISLLVRVVCHPPMNCKLHTDMTAFCLDAWCWTKPAVYWTCRSQRTGVSSSTSCHQSAIRSTITSSLDRLEQMTLLDDAFRFDARQ